MNTAFFYKIRSLFQELITQLITQSVFSEGFGYVLECYIHLLAMLYRNGWVIEHACPCC